MAKQSNLAYDLSRYEYQPKKAEPVIKAKKIVKPSASTPKTIATILVAGVMMCCVLYSKLDVSRIQNEITAQTKAVELLRSENVRMQTEIEEKTSLRNVENFAENQLGLQKLDKSQMEYVELQTENVVVIPENDTNIFVRISDKFNSILEYLRG